MLIKNKTNSFSHTVHVLFRREDIVEEKNLKNTVVVVLDILFATTTIVSAIANGARLVIPVRGEKSAREVASQYTRESPVLAGELYAETISGFASPTPLALGETGLKNKVLIYSTTNGTVALNQASESNTVYVGSLINAKAVVEKICSFDKNKSILVLCSGSMGLPNLEDAYGAGYFVDLLMKHRSGDIKTYSDAALAAQRIFLSGQPEETLFLSRVGRLMVERGKEREVKYAANLSKLDIAPELENNQVVVK